MALFKRKTDLKKLTDAYVKADEKKARKLLAKAKTEEEFLVCAIAYNGHGGIAAEAAAKLADRSKLFTAATKARDFKVCDLIIEASSDEALLKALVEYRGTGNQADRARTMAKRRLQELDRKKAKPKAKATERPADGITDPQRLFEALMNEKDGNFSSVSRITDNRLLLRLIKEAKSADIRKAAFRQIDADEAIIMDILSDKAAYQEFIWYSLDKIQAPKYLATTANDTSLDWKLRLRWLKKLLSIAGHSENAEETDLCGKTVKAFIEEARASQDFAASLKSICLSIPDGLQGKYGFEIRKTESEAEDQYGMHIEHRMYFTFDGKEYRLY